MKSRLSGQLRAIQSRWYPISVRVEQIQINRPSDEPLWFDWITRVAKYGISYEPNWLTVEQGLHELLTTDPDELSPAQAEPYLTDIDGFERVQESIRGGRFISAVLDRFDAPNVIVIGSVSDVSVLYLLASIGNGYLWGFNPSPRSFEIPIPGRPELSTRYTLVPEAFESGFLTHCDEVNCVDIAFVGALEPNESFERVVGLLEPKMPAGAIMLLHDAEWSDETLQAWSQVRQGNRVRWSALVEGTFGITELGEPSEKQ